MIFRALNLFNSTPVDIYLDPFSFTGLLSRQALASSMKAHICSHHQSLNSNRFIQRSKLYEF
jgi:hypothetical protein